MARKITAFKAQKRSTNRINVYLDGEFAFGLATIHATKLHVGMELSDADIERLKVADEVERARERALNYLSYRPRSMAEMERYLTKHEFSEAAIAEVLERLNRVGLMDDEAFAQYWVENRMQFRPRGKRALRQELREKGVAHTCIESVLEDVDEIGAAERVAESQARRLMHLPPDVFKRRLTQRMARRGFSYALIREVLATCPFPEPNSQESEEYEL